MDFTYLKNFMEHMTAEYTPGNAIEIYQSGTRIFQYASGYSDMETKKEMTGGEHFNLYSCSKVTTVTAALTLLEQGKFILSDPLYDYIPEYRHMYIQTEAGELIPAKNPITIGQLFNMTAGFSYEFDTSGFQKAREVTGGKMNTLEVIRCLAKDPLCFEPGTRWQYSLCHDVLAAVVEVISGMPFREYVRQAVFEPLEMNNSVYHHTPEVLANLASQYEYAPDKEEFVNVGPKVRHVIGEEYDSGGAGITSTTGDYVKLMEALANWGLGRSGERILSKGTVELMRTNSLSPELMKYFDWPQFVGYGYGLGVRTLVDKSGGGSTGSLGEFGWGGAAGATALSDPSRELAVFYAQHTLNPREEYYMPRLRNVIYACLDR